VAPDAGTEKPIALFLKRKPLDFGAGLGLGAPFGNTLPNTIPMTRVLMQQTILRFPNHRK